MRSPVSESNKIAPIEEEQKERNGVELFDGIVVCPDNREREGCSNLGNNGRGSQEAESEGGNRPLWRDTLHVSKHTSQYITRARTFISYVYFIDEILRRTRRTFGGRAQEGDGQVSGAL